MGIAELFFIAVGLSMDAFAVAICKGLAMKRLNVGQAALIALFFGGFQAGMPVIGWALGYQFAQFVAPVDHWIAFGLLAFIGGKMLVDAFKDEADELGETGAFSGDDGLAGKGGAAGSVAAGSGVAGAASSADAGVREADGGFTGDAGALGGNGDAAVSEPQTPLDMRELLMLAVATSIDALAVGVSFAFLQVNIVYAASFIGIVTFVLSFVGVAVGHQFGSRWERPSTLIGGIVLILIGAKILLEHLGIL